MGYRVKEYKTDNIELYNGDCLEVMDKLIKKGVKVDLTVTSPPYDNLRTYNNSLEWNEDIWKGVIKRLYDVTVDGGVVVWLVGDATIKGSETGTSFKQALYAIDCGFNLHDTMIYNKTCYVPLTHNRYEQSFEYMFVFSKGKLKTFNPIKINCVTAGTKRPRYKSNKEHGSAVRNDNRVDIINKQKQKNNVWDFRPNNTKHKHPAIFPEKLAHDHIISWSNENDIVLDCFMGSGTTGKMAKKLNRKFIGIEKETKYFDISVERVSKEAETQQLTLF